MLQGCTALLLAVQYEAEDIAEMLLDYGADVNTLKYQVSTDSINWNNSPNVATRHYDPTIVALDSMFVALPVVSAAAALLRLVSHAAPPAACF